MDGRKSDHKSGKEYSPLFRVPKVKSHKKKLADIAYNRPSLRLMNNMGACIKGWLPNFKKVTAPLKGQFLALQTLHQALHKELEAVELRRSDYHNNIELEKKTRDYLERKAVNESRLAEETLAFSEETKALQAQMAHVGELITFVGAAKALDDVTKLPEYKQMHKQVNDQLDIDHHAIDDMACCLHFFGKTAAVFKQTKVNIQALEAERQRLQSRDMDVLRDCVVINLGAQLSLLRQRFSALHPPVLAADHERLFQDIQAQKSMNEDDYYHRINNHVMLQFIRIYCLVDGIYQAIPKDGVSEKTPLVDPRRAFGGYCVDLKSKLEMFYCLDPDKFQFGDYYARYLLLDALDKKALLEDKAGMDIIKKVFHEYPEEGRRFCYTKFS